MSVVSRGIPIDRAPALVRALILILLCLPMLSWAANGTVTIGVLAFRPKQETLARWQPTADYLAARIDRRVKIEALTFPELDEAVHRRRLDFVLTNPAHYVQLAESDGLSSPLATLVGDEGGEPLSRFGGVIAVLASRNDINSLDDLRGKEVAAPDISSLGGYEMQAFELARAGLYIPGDIKLMVTGMPHDNALEAVLKGKADAGFVRTGVIESMEEEGSLAPGQVKILNPRKVDDFPFLLSTHLYPEWPFAAMPQVDENLAREVTAALYSMPPNHPAARRGHYHGWVIPTDYEQVREMMRALRLPPYDQMPAFTWHDVLAKHALILIAAAAGFLMVAVLLVLLAIRNRQLRVQEQRLSESELLFRQFADNSNVVFWVRTQDEILYISKAYETIWGRSCQSLYDNPASFMDSVHPGDQERVFSAMQYEAENPGSFDVEYRVVQPDGSWVWVHARSFTVSDADGRVIRTTGVAEDITARKRIELIIRERVKERDQLLAALGEGVYGVDMEGNGTFVNPAALAMLGYREEELLGRNQHDLIHHHRPEGAAYARNDCPLFRTLRDGQVRMGEEWFFRKDGSGFPVEMSVSPMERDGIRTGAVVAFHDISDRLAAQERDRLLVSALEAASNAVIITDSDGRIEWANPAFERLSGYGREEATGRTPAELQKSDEQDEAFYKAMWQTILAGRSWRGELINRKKNGLLYNEELFIAPVMDGEGRIHHFVGIKQDITERKRMEEELQNLATTDSLTGLSNRRSFLGRLDQETTRLQRFKEPRAALLMLDLDHFKQVNDTYGHAAGDKVLRSFAAVVHDSLRKTDQAGRLGGEEFAVLLFGTEERGAWEFAERLREQVASKDIPYDGGTLNISVSIGVTVITSDDATADAPMLRADEALYRAKANGRNRVEMA